MEHKESVEGMRVGCIDLASLHFVSITCYILDPSVRVTITKCYYNYARQVNPCAGFDHTTIGSGLGKKESYGLGWDPCEGSDCKKSDQ